MMASESCSTSSSSSGDDFVPFFFASQSYEVIPQNLRQVAEYNTVDETDAAAAAAETQFDENERDPDLDLCPPASRVGKTFWCQCGECVVQGSKIGTRLAPVVLVVSSVWRKFAQRRRTARRSTAVAVDLPVFSSILIQLRTLGRR